MVRAPWVLPRGCHRVVGSVLNRTEGTPRRSRNSASISPTGPPPTMATGVERVSACGIMGACTAASEWPTRLAGTTRCARIAPITMRGAFDRGVDWEEWHAVFGRRQRLCLWSGVHDARGRSERSGLAEPADPHH